MNIAITGEGIVSAIGQDKQSVLRSLKERRPGIGCMRFLQSAHTELPVAEVPLTNDEMKTRLGIPSEQEVSRTALMGMMAIGQALSEAHVTGREALRIVLINGTTVGGMDITEQHFDSLTEEAADQWFVQHDCGSCTQAMANHFGLFTDCTTISTACSAAANALLVGAEMLRNGEADIVVAGGTEALSRFHLNGFHSLMILDHEPCRPFDATRAGLNLGEGAAFLVLESEQLAKQRGMEPHAWLTGCGNACDAFHQTASSPNGEGAFRAMQEALTMADIQPADVSYVNAHGTGTTDNDRSESAALRRVFGSELPPMSSTKAFTGHTTSASGGIEAVISLLALTHQFVPANLGWTASEDDCITPTTGIDHAALSHVLCNSFGFGGNDTALVFSKEMPAATHFCSKDAPTVTSTQSAKDTSSIKVLSKVEISNIEDLTDIRQYVKPMEARRMGKLLKATLLSSLRALQEAGVACPDAIITGTAYGCLENSEKLLEQLRTDGETATVKPTFFMQSTHNTLSSAIAIKTGCHGYNVTYTQGTQSLEWALRDARRLLSTGRCRTVLVGCHDENTPLFGRLIEQTTGQSLPSIHSIAMVLSCGE